MTSRQIWPGLGKDKVILIAQPAKEGTCHVFMLSTMAANGLINNRAKPSVSIQREQHGSLRSRA
eukprot:6967109-Lingulodinium_polyedra.AAC.1